MSLDFHLILPATARKNLRALLFLTAITGPVLAGEAPLFGAADWKASPTDSVGFCGQGNGWYPGATPPIEWWEGRPTTITGKVTPRGGKHGVYTEEAKLPAYADAVAKNIRFKVPMPGWGGSLPIVVPDPTQKTGGRVICLGSPHHVVCLDASTGAVLWKDELELMPLPVLGKDRRTLETPDPAKSAALQKLFERTVATYRVWYATGLARGWGSKEVLPLIDLLADTVATWLPEIASVAPGLEKDYEASVTYWRAFAAAQRQGTPLETKSNDDKRNGQFLSSSRFLGVPIGNCWPGWISDECMASPVSDGQVVVAFFGFGQIGCWDLVSGKRRWAWRDPFICSTSASHLAAPLIWKDTVIITAGNKGGEGDAKFNTSVLGIDKNTGAVRWESGAGPGGCNYGGSHGDHMSPTLARLPDGAGGIRAVVIANRGAVLDPDTGATLAQLPAAANNSENNTVGFWGSGFVCSVGNLIHKGCQGDGSPPPNRVWPLTIGTGGSVTVGQGLTCALGGDRHDSFAASDRMLVGGGDIFDPLTGRRMAKISNGVPTITKDFVISTYGIAQSYRDGRVREDQLCLQKFVVTGIEDPYHPVEWSDNSLLGDAEYPRDLADRHFPGFAARPMKRWGLRGYRGMGGGFGHDTGGVMAWGDRLYILSHTSLYCIAPSVRGTPGDDPAVVAAIRGAGATDLEKHLSSNSAQYRYEALVRLATLPADAALLAKTQERLASLAKQDPYEEIRAAAVRALSVMDPAGQAGSKTLLAAFAAARLNNSQEQREVRLTLRSLGRADGTKILIAALALAADDPARYDVINFAGWMGWTAPELTTAATAQLTANRNHRGALAYLAHVALTDAKVLEMLRQRHPKEHHETRSYTGVLCRTLTGTAQQEFLISALRVNDSNNMWMDGERQEIIRTLISLGKKAEPILPELERFIEERPVMGLKLAPALTAIAGEERMRSILTKAKVTLP
jgi:outer membrane protein assembly factor BamB